MIQQKHLQTGVNNCCALKTQHRWRGVSFFLLYEMVELVVFFFFLVIVDKEMTNCVGRNCSNATVVNYFKLF